MKKVFALAVLLLGGMGAMAQNIQFHYDLGKYLYPDNEHNRQTITITYEGFHADKLGSWYYFIDADFNKNGVVGAYTELSREFTFMKLGESSSLAAHAEIDAGLSRGAGIFQPAFLVGPAWNWHNGDFSKTVSVQLMYKQFTGQNFNVSGDPDFGKKVKPYCSFQLTGVWGLNFFNNKMTFSGFIDFWRGVNYWNNHGNLTILTEPQLWYNFNKHCSVGTEWEMSNNFIYSNVSGRNDKFYFNPTVAFKYNF